jgi:hypothetical protein
MIIKNREYGKMAEDKVFVDGMFFKFVGPYGEKPDGTPKFVLSRASINCSKLVEFLRKNHNDGWVNFDILLSKDETKVYPQLNTWKPEAKKESGGDDWGSEPPPQDTRDFSEGDPDGDVPF